MAISPQRLTVYLYSAHRAVIFAIAQLSCNFKLVRKFNLHMARLMCHFGLLRRFVFEIRLRWRVI